MVERRSTNNAVSPSGDAPEHLYIHVPFCSGRCGYCSFVSGKPPRNPERYIDTLLREAEERKVALPPLQTLYCGGGTPTLLGVEGFRRLVTCGLFSLAEGAEWTVEAHPATLTEELLETLVACGVNRLSIGVQSFNDAVLERCNRRHTARQAMEAVRMAQRFIPDTGIDLIAGLPGVTSSIWQDTLSRAIDLGVDHVSVYALSVDEGSAWHKLGFAPPDAEQVCDAIGEAVVAFEKQGLLRYETSNYARVGRECRHNLNTWHGGDYVGLGRGAVSRIGLLRRYGDGMEERLSPLDDALERALPRLRLSEGFNLDVVQEDYPALHPFILQWRRRIQMFEDEGLLTANSAPTLRGYEVLDAMERVLLEDAVAIIDGQRGGRHRASSESRIPE